VTTTEASAATEQSLTAQLAAWIESEGIAKGDVAGSTAATLTEDDTMRRLAADLLATGDAPKVLRDAATGVADLASMGLEAWVTENYHHGHLAQDLRRS